MKRFRRSIATLVCASLLAIGLGSTPRTAYAEESGYCVYTIERTWLVVSVDGEEVGRTLINVRIIDVKCYSDPPPVRYA